MAAAYDSTKAKIANQLLQQGFPLDQALAQAGIDSADAGNYGLSGGRVVAADYDTVEIDSPNSPGSTATYGSSYQPAQSFGAINLNAPDQPSTGYVNPITSGVVTTSPPLQELNTYPPPNLPTTTNSLAGIQVDVGGFPVAAADPAVPSTFNTSAGAITGGYGQFYSTETTQPPPAQIDTTTTFPGVVTTVGGFGSIVPSPEPVDPAVQPGLPGIVATTPGYIQTSPDPVDDTAGTPVYSGASFNAASLRANIDAADQRGAGQTAVNLDVEPSSISVGDGTDPGIAPQVLRAQNSNTVREQRRSVNNRDWRVRLRLSPRSNYLYNDAAPGSILFPLQTTDGVIFPYTPTISTSYNANYSQYDLTHSNFKGYFYQNSNVGAIQLAGKFTAQDTAEANYLLAVIHFFRSVTKMFYGQDANAGAPPPLMFLSGFGQYQFNEHPVLITTFNYSLPNDVDYIRCQSTNQAAVNLLTARNRNITNSNPLSAAYQRLQTLFGKPPPGADPTLSQVSTIAPELGGDKPTYVPTQMEISLSLLPVNTRSQISQQFSVKGFASGDLLQGGFW